MQTFLELKKELRALIWPPGEARTLRAAHDAQFIEAMIDLQKWVPCLQANNVSQFEQCGTYWEDAKTLVNSPNGIIRAVYTLANGEWRDKVRYESASWLDMLAWAKQLWLSVTPKNLGLPVLPTGIKFAEKAADSTIGRARCGIYAVHRQKLYVAPWIQSNETLVVEWDGVKETWSDTDGLDPDLWGNDVKEAIKLFVRWKHESAYGTDLTLKASLAQDYQAKLADLIWSCNEKTRQRERHNLDPDRDVTQDEMLASAVPAASSTTFQIGLFGDWGADDGSLSTQFTALVDVLIGKGVKRVITVGDNIYNNSVAISTLLGRLQDNFDTTFCYGNHDFDRGINDIVLYVPQSGNGRYFSVVVGPVHFFILSTDPREVDGGYVDANTSTEGSIMGEWLKVSLAMSTSPWKIVDGHHTPYSSDVNNYPGNAWMRWPFKTWGADIYLCGHGHSAEYVIGTDGFPYLQNGAGGNSIRTVHSPVTTGSQWIYRADYAVTLLTATCDKLTFEIVNTAGVTVQTVELTK